MKYFWGLFITYLSLVKCEKIPLECLPQAERMRGFTFCHFVNQSSADHDVTKVKLIPNRFQGRQLESSQVTALFISYSDFDRIPSAIFENFGDVTRLKIVNSKIKNIDRNDFATAIHLRVLEIEESQIGTVSSNAFGLLENLREIRVEKCEIESFASDALDGLEKLETIALLDNIYMHSEPSIKNKPE